MAPFQLPSGSGLTQLQTQLALSQMLAPIQGVQPSVVLELNAATNKDGIGEEHDEALICPKNDKHLFSHFHIAR